MRYGLPFASGNRESLSTVRFACSGPSPVVGVSSQVLPSSVEYWYLMIALSPGLGAVKSTPMPSSEGPPWTSVGFAGEPALGSDAVTVSLSSPGPISLTARTRIW
ncbi:hypothetical protein [Couchioplanes azureus]